MTYESTGEVRRPKAWEPFLCPHNVFDGIQRSANPDDCSEVIMRPVEEPSFKKKSWCVVIPYGRFQNLALKNADTLLQDYGYGCIVREIEL